MNTLKELFKKYRSVGVVGNTNTAKSSLILSELIELKGDTSVDIYVLGAETNLHKYLESKGINILHSVDDILDMKIKNSVLYIDEFGDIFNVQASSKQTDRIRRFFNRLAHQNNYVIVSTAQTKFWNVFMCSLVKAYLVKEIEFDSLVNGTLLKRKIKNISENTSEYRLDIPIGTYYVIRDDKLTEKKTFEYDENIDSKNEQVDIFQKADETLD